jgi:hypothetical protein
MVSVENGIPWDYSNFLCQSELNVRNQLHCSLNIVKPVRQARFLPIILDALRNASLEVKS